MLMRALRPMLRGISFQAHPRLPPNNTLTCCVTPAILSGCKSAPAPGARPVLSAGPAANSPAGFPTQFDSLTVVQGAFHMSPRRVPLGRFCMALVAAALLVAGAAARAQEITEDMVGQDEKAWQAWSAAMQLL